MILDNTSYVFIKADILYEQNSKTKDISASLLPLSAFVGGLEIGSAHMENDNVVVSVILQLDAEIFEKGDIRGLAEEIEQATGARVLHIENCNTTPAGVGYIIKQQAKEPISESDAKDLNLLTTQLAEFLGREVSDDDIAQPDREAKNALATVLADFEMFFPFSFQETPDTQEHPVPLPVQEAANDGIPAREKLERLVGLESVKSQVDKIIRVLKNSGARDLPCMHMVFTGNPGVGKTTVARLMAQILKDEGVLENSHPLVEVGRSDLVGKYVGQTAPLTKTAIEQAQGGMLFIDEAYSLGMYGSNGESGRDFGEEAISELVQDMDEGGPRSNFICIMSGYSKPMEKMLDINPGLRDRVGFYVDFPDYSPQELLAIFAKFAEDDVFTIDNDAKSLILEHLESMCANKGANFSNGRAARKIYQRCKMESLSKTPDRMISREDVEDACSYDDIAKLCAGSGKPKVGFCS